jgi:hypothetical protein
MSYDGSWDENFPPVMHFVDLENACAKPWKFLEAHPDYDAAKNHEDRVAALRLVRDFLRTPENQAQILTLKQKYSGAIIVPVRAIEIGGKNRIPEALAEYIGMNTGLEVNDNIIQTNRVHRTGTDEWHRFAFRPSYDGMVKIGRNYLLVDDVFSLGGSFNELRCYIEANGGKVVHTIALATGRSGPEISLNPKTLKNLVDRYGANKLESFLKEIDLYDGNCKALTEPEARALRRTPSLDEARDRIFAARCQRRAPMVSGSIQETQSQTSIISPKNNNPHRGRSI